MMYSHGVLLTPQVYPTATRALGLGTSSGMARVGALITPFVAQVKLKKKLPQPIYKEYLYIMCTERHYPT